MPTTYDKVRARVMARVRTRVGITYGSLQSLTLTLTLTLTLKANGPPKDAMSIKELIAATDLPHYFFPGVPPVARHQARLISVQYAHLVANVLTRGLDATVVRIYILRNQEIHLTLTLTLHLTLHFYPQE